MALQSFIAQVIKQIQETQSDENAFDEEDVRQQWAALLSNSISTLVLAKRVGDVN